MQSSVEFAGELPEVAGVERRERSIREIHVNGGPEWQIEAVAPDGEFNLKADGRTVMVRHVPTVHNEDMLVVYLPESRVLFVSDIYQPGVFPIGEPLPEPFSDWSQGLRERLPTFAWEVEWIVGGHGGVDSIADVHSHFGKVTMK